MKFRVQHSGSCLGEVEAGTASASILADFVGYGERARSLEDALRSRTGRAHAFAVSSGYHALMLAIRALDLVPGARIGLPVLTCPSVLAAVAGNGHEPHLVDIDAATMGMDTACANTACTAFVVPHAYGLPVVLRDERPIIEDCASAPWAEYEGIPTGAFGTVSIFSFASTKYATGGMGGAVVTGCDRVAARIADLLDFDSFEKTGEWKKAPPPAMPGRMADLNAAVAVEQWKQLPSFVAKRRELAAGYRSALQGLPGVTLPIDRAEHTYYRFIVRLNVAAASSVEAMRARGWDVRSSVNPWLQDSRTAGYVFTGGPWPVAEQARHRLLSLPLHPRLCLADCQALARDLKEVLQNG